MITGKASESLSGFETNEIILILLAIGIAIFLIWWYVKLECKGKEKS